MVEYSGSVDERVKQVHIRTESHGETYRHTDGLRTEKLTWVFSSGELKSNDISTAKIVYSEFQGTIEKTSLKP